MCPVFAPVYPTEKAVGNSIARWCFRGKRHVVLPIIGTDLQTIPYEQIQFELNHSDCD